MWIGKDEHHGDIGIIIEALQSIKFKTRWYNVQWSDGVLGEEIHHLELMAVEDE